MILSVFIFHLLGLDFFVKLFLFEQSQLFSALEVRLVYIFGS